MSFTIPATLQKQIKNQQLVPLIGAGVSMSLTDDEGKRVWQEGVVGYQPRRTWIYPHGFLRGTDKHGYTA